MLSSVGQALKRSLDEQVLSFARVAEVVEIVLAGPNTADLSIMSRTAEGFVEGGHIET